MAEDEDTYPDEEERPSPHTVGKQADGRLGYGSYIGLQRDGNPHLGDRAAQVGSVRGYDRVEQRHAGKGEKPYGINWH